MVAVYRSVAQGQDGNEGVERTLVAKFPTREEAEWYVSQKKDKNGWVDYEIRTNDYERGELDTLIRLSNVYNGKQYYFEQDNGMIYSRESDKLMTLEEAIREFEGVLDIDGC